MRVGIQVSVWRKITVNVFYSTFTNVFFIFCHVFLRFLTFFIFGGTFFHLCSASITLLLMTAQSAPEATSVFLILSHSFYSFTCSFYVSNLNLPICGT